MTESKIPSNLIEQRIDMDLVKRSIPGVFIYAFFMPMIFYFFDFFQQESAISWYITLAMFILSAMRLLHFHLTEQFYIYSSKLWFISFSALSLSQATIIGIIFAFALTDPRFSPINNVMFLTLGGFSGGALTSLMPRLRLALTNLSLLLIPAALVSLNSSVNNVFAVIIILYFIYLCTLGFRSNKEYLRAFQIELMLEHQRAELEKTNKIDPLTHLYNRGYFNTAYEHQWNNGIRNQHQQSLLLIDVDNFKFVNDTYGHLFGDQCLISIAKTIQDTVQRKTDIAARFGGEEFIVLLSDTSTKEALFIAEAMREKIADHAFVLNKTTVNITISIGVASLVPKSSIHPNQLIENADKCLYQAKNEGRNKVCFKE